MDKSVYDLLFGIRQYNSFESVTSPFDRRDVVNVKLSCAEKSVLQINCEDDMNDAPHDFELRQNPLTMGVHSNLCFGPSDFAAALALDYK